MPGPAGEPPLLEAVELTRRGDQGALLLDGVSLRLAAGERLVIAGPSGAGKSLLLRALALLDPVDSGTVRFRGEEIPPDGVPAFRARVAYLHQRSPLFEGTVEADLRLPFTLAVHRGRSFDRERILCWLAELGRDGGFLAKFHRDLSGGEAQITNLLRILQLDPEVLLLDEPTAALDGETAARAEGLLLAWLAAGPGERGLVWVSHDREQGRRLATRTAHLAAGRLVAGRLANGDGAGGEDP